MIAMLGMYDMPAIQSANDRYWALIRDHLGIGPDALTRDVDPWQIWQASDLVLAQTCGLPYRTRLHQYVTLVGTPDYGLRDCPPGFYCSVIIVRKDAKGSREVDFDGSKFAYNEALSQSGWAAPMSHLSAKGVEFQEHIPTGAHAASARAVATGHADIAGIDALTWALLQEHDPVAGNLRVIATTIPTPGLPYITSPAQDGEKVAAAIRNAIRSLEPADRAALHVKGLVNLQKETYLAVPTPPGP